MLEKPALLGVVFYKLSALAGIGPDNHWGDNNLRRNKSRLHTEQVLRGITVTSALSRGFSKAQHRGDY